MASSDNSKPGRHAGADRQDRGAAELQRVRGAELDRLLRGLPEPRAGEPEGHAQRVPARLRHDHVATGQEEYIDNKKKLVRYNFFKDEQHGGRDAIFGLDIPLMRLVNVLKAAAAGLRHREARHPAARPGRLVEVDDRAPPEEGHRGLLAHARRRALHLRLGAARGARARRRRRRRSFPCADARGAAAPHPARVARRRRSTSSGSQRRSSRSSVEGDLNPACRLIFHELMAHYEGDWSEGHRAHPRASASSSSEKDRVGIGTFQPKDEKNQDSTELTGDINYRKIAEYGSDSRSARVQLRRRVQHRQPRHRRVHRGAQARRRVPLRPARRVAGAQDQAEEVRADRHRRGHHRPHQRGRVQEAPEQRVHGGAARPHDQDRHPVHHAG